MRKILRSGATAFEDERTVQPRPRLGPWRADLERLLAANAARSNWERLTLMRIFEDLRGRGHPGGDDAVRRFAMSWRRRENAAMAAAYVPLSFAPGEAYQFDWSHEIVVIDGVTTIVKVAPMRLCHSRMPFVRAYPRESQAQRLRCGCSTPTLACAGRQPTPAQCPGVCFLQGRLHARDLRQHEDRSRHGLRRQGARLQPPLPADADLDIPGVTGELGDEERREKIAELGASRRRLLVATDCLSEGINLQDHFDAVVHYDLPWNPNRLEQREGRIDRFGHRPVPDAPLGAARACRRGPR